MAYHARAIHGLGWTMVVLGSLSIVLGIAAVATFASKGQPTYFHYIAGPIWSGVFVLITGILGVVSGRKPTNKCLIVAFMIMGIFTIVAAFICLGLAATGGVIDRCYTSYDYVNYNDYDYDYRYPTDPYDYDNLLNNRTGENSTRAWPVPVPAGPVYRDLKPQRTSVVHNDEDGCTRASKALHGVNALLALAEVVLGFVVSIMCCCGLASSSPGVVYGPGVAPAQVMSSGQGGFLLLQAVPCPQHLGPHQQVFIAQQPHGGPMAPLQVYYTAGQAPPPQYSQSVGMGATTTPPQYSQQGGMGATAAPPQLHQQAGVEDAQAPPLDTKTPLTA